MSSNPNKSDQSTSPGLTAHDFALCSSISSICTLQKSQILVAISHLNVREKTQISQLITAFNENLAGNQRWKTALNEVEKCEKGAEMTQKGTENDNSEKEKCQQLLLKLLKIVQLGVESRNQSQIENINSEKFASHKCEKSNNSSEKCQELAGKSSEIAHDLKQEQSVQQKQIVNDSISDLKIAECGENQLKIQEFERTILDQMGQFKQFFDQKNLAGIDNLKSSLNEKIGVFKQSGLEIPEVVREKIQELKGQIKQFEASVGKNENSSKNVCQSSKIDHQQQKSVNECKNQPNSAENESSETEKIELQQVIKLLISQYNALQKQQISDEDLAKMQQFDARISENLKQFGKNLPEGLQQQINEYEKQKQEFLLRRLNELNQEANDVVNASDDEDKEIDNSAKQVKQYENRAEDDQKIIDKFSDSMLEQMDKYKKLLRKQQIRYDEGVDAEMTKQFQVLDQISIDFQETELIVPGMVQKRIDSLIDEIEKYKLLKQQQNNNSQPRNNYDSVPSHSVKNEPNYNQQQPQQAMTVENYTDLILQQINQYRSLLREQQVVGPQEHQSNMYNLGQSINSSLRALQKANIQLPETVQKSFNFLQQEIQLFETAKQQQMLQQQQQQIQQTPTTYRQNSPTYNFENTQTHQMSANSHQNASNYAGNYKINQFQYQFDRQLQQIKNLGIDFSDEQILSALVQFGGDCERATDLMLNGGNTVQRNGNQQYIIPQSQGIKQSRILTAKEQLLVKKQFSRQLQEIKEMDMGFSDGQILAALNQSAGDCEETVNLLLNDENEVKRGGSYQQNLTAKEKLLLQKQMKQQQHQSYQQGLQSQARQQDIQYTVQKQQPPNLGKQQDQGFTVTEKQFIKQYQQELNQLKQIYSLDFTDREILKALQESYGNFQQASAKLQGASQPILPVKQQVAAPLLPIYQQMMEKYTQQYYQVQDMFPDFTPQKILSALNNNFGNVELAIDNLMANQSEVVQPGRTVQQQVRNEYEPINLLPYQKEQLEQYRQQFYKIKDMKLPNKDGDILSALDLYKGDVQKAINHLLPYK